MRVPLQYGISININILEGDICELRNDFPVSKVEHKFKDTERSSPSFHYGKTSCFIENSNMILNALGTRGLVHPLAHTPQEGDRRSKCLLALHEILFHLKVSVFLFLRLQELQH